MWLKKHSHGEISSQTTNGALNVIEDITLQESKGFLILKSGLAT